jgi:hypothetical protein
MMTPDDIEVVAKALYTERVVARHNPIKWDDSPGAARQSFRREAAAAIQALDGLRAMAQRYLEAIRRFGYVGLSAGRGAAGLCTGGRPVEKLGHDARQQWLKG